MDNVIESLKSISDNKIFEMINLKEDNLRQFLLDHGFTEVSHLDDCPFKTFLFRGINVTTEVRIVSGEKVTVMVVSSNRPRGIIKKEWDISVYFAAYIAHQIYELTKSVLDAFDFSGECETSFHNDFASVLSSKLV